MPVKTHVIPIICMGRGDIAVCINVDRARSCVGVDFTQLVKARQVGESVSQGFFAGPTVAMLTFTSREAIDVLISRLTTVRAELPANPKVESTSSRWELLPKDAIITMIDMAFGADRTVEWVMAGPGPDAPPAGTAPVEESPAPVSIDAEVESARGLKGAIDVSNTPIDEALSSASVSRHLHEDLGPQAALLLEFDVPGPMTYRIVAEGPDLRVDVLVNDTPDEWLPSDDTYAARILAVYNKMADRIEEARES